MIQTLVLNGADKMITDQKGLRAVDSAVSSGSFFTDKSFIIKPKNWSVVSVDYSPSIILAIINSLANDEKEALSIRQQAKESEYRQFGAQVFQTWREKLDKNQNERRSYPPPQETELLT